MKKILLIVLFFFPPAYAYEYGFFSGIDGTATSWELNTDTDFVPDPPADSSYSNDEWDYSALARFGMYLQWGENGQWFSAVNLLGAVHDVYIHNTVGTFDTTDFVSQITEANYTLGAELKQGMFLWKHLLGFVTAGFVYTQYKVTTDFFSATPGLVNTPPVSDSEKFYLPGFRFGAGLEQWLIPELSIAGHVTYTAYEDKTLNYPLEETQFNPSALEIGLGVNFYF